MLICLKDLFFPRKCILCGKLLDTHQTDLCPGCRINAPVFPKPKIKFSFIAHWTALWYYKNDVRSSLLRYKFYGRRGYGQVYGRFLAMRLMNDRMEDFDVLTWVPISRLRRFRRGYDQVELIAQAVAAELKTDAVPTLKKIRNTPPQSGLKDAAHRRANVLGAYRAVDPDIVRGKRVLLLDDIVTTGATVSECARVLLTAGAKEVCFAAIAAAPHDKK